MPEMGCACSAAIVESAHFVMALTFDLLRCLKNLPGPSEPQRRKELSRCELTGTLLNTDLTESHQSTRGVIRIFFDSVVVVDNPNALIRPVPKLLGDAVSRKDLNYIIYLF